MIFDFEITTYSRDSMGASWRMSVPPRWDELMDQGVTRLVLASFKDAAGGQIGLVAFANETYQVAYDQEPLPYEVKYIGSDEVFAEATFWLTLSASTLSDVKVSVSPRAYPRVENKTIGGELCREGSR
jgi:hypothetical protein